MNFAIYNSHRRHVPTTATSLAYSNSHVSELQMSECRREGGRVFTSFLRQLIVSCRELCREDIKYRRDATRRSISFHATYFLHHDSYIILSVEYRLCCIVVAWKTASSYMRLLLRIIDF